MCFPPAVVAADEREVPYHRRLASCQRGRCLAGARSGFLRGFEMQRDARGGGNSGRCRRGGNSTVVVRRRLLVTVLRVFLEAVIFCGGLTLALVLSARVTTAVAILIVRFLV